MTDFRLDRIVAEGFSKITEWEWRNPKIRLASLDWTESSSWLYAFVVDDRVMYVGLTERVLRSRMDNYRDSPGDQNERLRELIKAELGTGHRVDVYGKRDVPAEDLHCEEDRLRREWDPPWNLI